MNESQQMSQEPVRQESRRELKSDSADEQLELATSLPGWDLLPPQGMVVRRKRVSET